MSDTSIDFSTIQLNELRKTSGHTGGSGGKGNWLMALAAAMGSAQGKLADAMIGALNKMDSLSSPDLIKADGGAQAFQVAATEFQALAQMFGILSNANATSLKSIGEGMVSIARK